MGKKIYTLVAALLLLSLGAYSQGLVDHANNDLYYTTNTKCSFTFGTNYAGVSLAFFYDSSEKIFSDANSSHVAHANALILSASLTDYNTNLNLFFSPASQPTISLNFGHSFNSVTNFINWDQLKLGRRNWLGAVDRDLYVGVFATKSFMNYWDTVNRKMTDQTLSNYNKNSFRDFDQFISFGLKVNYNLYYTRWLALALTGTVQNGFTQPFADFQSSPASAYNVPNNVYSMNDFAGRVGGDANTRINDMRFSIGLPIFMGAIFNNVAKNDHKKATEGHIGKTQRTLHRVWNSLFIMPHYAQNGWVNGHWRNEVGVSINFLQAPFGGGNSRIAVTEGLGVDWMSRANTKNGWSSPIYYLTGKLNIGKSPNGGERRMVARRKALENAPAAAPAAGKTKDEE